MNDKKYIEIQEALRKHLDTAHGYSGNKKEIFREGIRVAMSIVHQMYNFPKAKS